MSLSSTLPTVNPPQSGDANRPTNAGRSSNDGGVAFEWLRCEVAPPVAVNDTSSGLFGANQTVTDVTSNDAAGDNPIDTASVTIDTNANAATEGTCSVTTSPAVQFVPVANFAGDATCTYQVCDNGTPATCDTADVTFTVGAGSAPVANDDTVGTPQGVAIVVDVVGGSTLGAVTDTCLLYTSPSPRDNR